MRLVYIRNEVPHVGGKLRNMLQTIVGYYDHLTLLLTTIKGLGVIKMEG